MNINRYKVVSIVALSLYSILLALTVFVPNVTLFSKTYTLLRSNRSTFFNVVFGFNDNKLDTGLIVGTWLTFIGAVMFGIITYLLTRANHKIEYIGFCSILWFGSFSYYIYLRSISFNALLQLYEKDFANQKLTVTARSGISLATPIIIFVFSILLWILSIWSVRRYTQCGVGIETKKCGNEAELQIEIIPSHCKEYNSVPGPSLDTIIRKSRNETQGIVQDTKTSVSDDSQSDDSQSVDSQSDDSQNDDSQNDGQDHKGVKNDEPKESEYSDNKAKVMQENAEKLESSDEESSDEESDSEDNLPIGSIYSPSQITIDLKPNNAQK